MMDSQQMGPLPAELGFVSDPVGTHSSRTIMLEELSRLLEETPSEATYDELWDAATNRNALKKSSASGRAKTFRHLREFYGLRQNLPVYSAMRRLWDWKPEERPLLAMLCACARDPILRTSSEIVLDTAVGGQIGKGDLEGAVWDEYPGRYSPDVMARMTRNLLSSWTQSGHLQGRIVKTRRKAQAGLASTVYALALGFLCGLQGRLLFGTLWTRILDCSVSEAQAYAADASARGLITYKQAGGVIEVDFSPLLRER